MNDVSVVNDYYYLLEIMQRLTLFAPSFSRERYVYLFLMFYQINIYEKEAPFKISRPLVRIKSPFFPI